MYIRKLYLIIIMIGVLLATYFIYTGTERIGLIPTTASLAGNEEIEAVFPAPGQTLYKMGLYLDITTRTMFGSTILTTKNTSGSLLNELWFTAYPNAFRDSKNTPAPSNAYYAGFNEGWLEFQKFMVNGEEVEYYLDGVSVHVMLPQDILLDNDICVEMEWQARIPKLAYRYGSKDGAYMLGNFYPTLNVLGSAGWHNSYNSVFGDPFCFNCADYQVNLSLPEGYRLVSTGINRQTIAEDNGREIYKIEAQNVRDFCLAVLYDYNESKDENNQIHVKCYAPRQNSDLLQQIIKQTAEILHYYACTWGSYPYPDFKVVFVPMKGFHGMEYSGLIFLSQEFLNPKVFKERGEFILAHEIAHQWWYGMVGNDQLKEPWLDEGLANWSAYQYLEKYKGTTSPGAQKLSDGIFLAREMKDIFSKQEYYQTAYSGGEAFWFGLEQELGKDTVNKVLRRYLADYRFKIATTDDLLEVIKIEAHKDMTDYFGKWFKE